MEALESRPRRSTSKRSAGGDRRSVATPRPASPAATAIIVAELAEDVGTDGPVGLGFPGVVKHGVTATTANLHSDRIGTNAEMLFAHHLGGRQVAVISDRRKGV